MLKKIHHVGIVVRSIATAYAFYRSTLSLPVHKPDEAEHRGDLSAAAAAAPGGVAVGTGRAGCQRAHRPGESGVRGG